MRAWLAGYQVLVASDVNKLRLGEADVWDSGKVVSSESLNIRYAGPALLARQQGVWTVRVWDKQDRASSFAAPSTWEVGPWDEEVEGDWSGLPSSLETPALPSTICFQATTISGASATGIKT
jgi:alpha-L-rhamnosidase